MWSFGNLFLANMAADREQDTDHLIYQAGSEKISAEQSTVHLNFL